MHVNIFDLVHTHFKPLMDAHQGLPESGVFVQVRFYICRCKVMCLHSQTHVRFPFTQGHVPERAQVSLFSTSFSFKIVKFGLDIEFCLQLLVSVMMALYS